MVRLGGVSEGSAAAPCLTEGPAVLHGPGCLVPPFVGLSVATVGWEVRSDLEPSSLIYPMSWPTGDLR